MKKEKETAQEGGLQQQTGDVEQLKVFPQVDVVNLPEKGAENIVYVPKKVGEKKALLLVPQSTKKQSNK